VLERRALPFDSWDGCHWQTKGLHSRPNDLGHLPSALSQTEQRHPAFLLPVLLTVQ
jgi:hypothetical protein